MRYFLGAGHPKTARILIVESGSRGLVENLLPHLRGRYGQDVPIGLVTCYDGLPEGLPPQTTSVWRVSDYGGRVGRKRLYRELTSQRYTILAMLCSGVPIMTKWKWAIACRLPVKVLVVNENGDFFWLDRANWRTLRHFLFFRAGLSGGDAVRTIARVALFPVTLLYLLLYAAAIHFRRKVHG